MQNMINLHVHFIILVALNTCKQNEQSENAIKMFPNMFRTIAWSKLRMIISLATKTKSILIQKYITTNLTRDRQNTTPSTT